uniref:CSON008466 protein n=1 Tax=Culicoides sonorensis TaxID=179676 RepID=A0A336LNM9_CULSO
MPSGTQGFDYINEVTIGGHKTDIACHKFKNQTLLIVTQYGKMANVLSVENQVFNGAMTNKQKVYEIKPKLGNVSDETQGAIRYLMNYLQCNNLIISLALKVINKDILIELRDELGKIQCLK